MAERMTTLCAIPSVPSDQMAHFVEHITMLFALQSKKRMRVENKFPASIHLHEREYNNNDKNTVYKLKKGTKIISLFLWR